MCYLNFSQALDQVQQKWGALYNALFSGVSDHRIEISFVKPKSKDLIYLQIKSCLDCDKDKENMLQQRQ